MKVRYSYLPQQFNNCENLWEQLKHYVSGGDFTLGEPLKKFEILGVWNSHSTLNHSDFMPSHIVSESYSDSLLMLLTSLR